MLKERLLIIIVLAFMTAAAWSVVNTGDEGETTVTRTEVEVMTSVPLPPDIPEPSKVVLPTPDEVVTGETVEAEGDLDSVRYEDSVIILEGLSGVTISGCEFINTYVAVIDCGPVYITGNVFRDNYGYETPCITVYGAYPAMIDGNEFRDVTTGVYIAGADEAQVSNNYFYDCFGDYALRVGGETDYSVMHANVYNNVFRYCYPGAVYVTNPASYTEMTTDVHHNLVEYSYGYGITYYDYRGASEPSTNHHNRMTMNGWSGLYVGGNSWSANLVVEENYMDVNGLLHAGIIDAEGRPTEIFPVHPVWTGSCEPGPQDGLTLYETSGVHVRANVMTDNFGDGVNIGASYGIILEENVVAGNQGGIIYKEFDAAAVDPEFAHLIPEDTDGPCLYIRENYVFDNHNDNWVMDAKAGHVQHI